MANGYGSVMTLLQEEENVRSPQPVPRAVLLALPQVPRRRRRVGCGVRRQEPALGLQGRVAGVGRRRFVGNYIDRLERVRRPGAAAAGQGGRGDRGRTTPSGSVLAAAWPLNFLRSDPMGPADFEWFENHYPGWSAVYQPFWDGYKPDAGPVRCHLMLQELPALPPFCQVCKLPCAMPHLGINEFRWSSSTTASSTRCAARAASGSSPPGRRCYAGGKQFWAKYHGWDLADVILDLGYVRPTAKPSSASRPRASSGCGRSTTSARSATR